MDEQEAPTGLKVKVTVYILRHDGSDYDSRWESIYASAAARDVALAGYLLSDYGETYDEGVRADQEEEDEEEPEGVRKPWDALTVDERVAWYFEYTDGDEGTIEWEYVEDELVYDIADLKPA